MDEDGSDRNEPLLSDEGYGILGEKDALAFSSDAYVRRKIIRWMIRTLVGVILFSFLAWKFTWGKWLLYAWIPMAALSLFVILGGKFLLNRKLHEVEAEIQSTRAPRKTPGSEMERGDED